MNRFFTYKTTVASPFGGLLLSIMMLTSLVTQAQNTQSGGGSNNAQPVKAKALSSLRSITSGTFTLNGTSYTSWSDAMQNLQEDNNEIILTSDLYLLDEQWPDKPCTISSDGNDKKELKNAYTDTDGQEYYANISMRAPLTFKNIKLGTWNIFANGHKLVMDEGIECISGYNEVSNAIRAIYGTDGDASSTEIIIRSGSYGWIYGGSGNTGNVSGKTQVTMEGGKVNGTIFGGGHDGNCGNTEIMMNGGETEWVYGGNANQGSVTGSAKVSISGNAKVFGNVYGGSANASSSVGSTEVYINTSSTIQNVYGGGDESPITNNTQVTIENGEFFTVYGGGYNSTVGGNVNLIAKGGIMQILGIKSPSANITGTINITIEGGKTNFNGSAQINGGNDTNGTDKDCTLTFQNCGTGTIPYNIPTIYGVSKVVLTNSYITKEPSDQANPAFMHNLFTPLIIEGSGMKGSFEIQALGSPAIPITGTTIVKATGLTADATFTTNDYSLYKVGKTYRYGGSKPEYKTINITQPDAAIGTLSVKLSDGTELENGDQVPNGTALTITATSTSGKTLVVKNGDDIITTGTLTVSADINLTVEEKKPESLDLSEQTTDITISKEGDIWKYLAEAITRTTPAPVAFNGIVTGTLPDGKSVLIDASSTGTLTFENAVINATSSGAALIIAQGANITIAGKVTATTTDTNSPAIQNDGNITAESNAAITATNTGEASKGISISTGGTLLLSDGSSLTASGLENAGTVVVKEGATFNSPSGSDDLLKTYAVTITAPGYGNTLTVKTGDISIATGDKIAENTVITLTATTATDYTLQSITVTPENEASITIANNGTYKMPAKAITITANFSYNPPYVPPVYHTVTLPSVEGAVTDPAAGGHEVEAWDNFVFRLTLDEDYNQSVPVVTTDRGETLEPRTSDGAYIVKNVRSDLVITISGIVKNPAPVANAVIRSGSIIVSRGGLLIITTARPMQAQVITFGGQVARSLSLPAGKTRIDALAAGTYIVRLSDGTVQKVVVKK